MYYRPSSVSLEVLIFKSSRYMKDKDVHFIQINISKENCHAMKMNTSAWMVNYLMLHSKYLQ